MKEKNDQGGGRLRGGPMIIKGVEKIKRDTGKKEEIWGGAKTFEFTESPPPPTLYGGKVDLQQASTSFVPNQSHCIPTEERAEKKKYAYRDGSLAQEKKR